MLTLASRSPRRAELLKSAGFDFTIRAADIDETPRESEAPDEYVLRIAEAKAMAITSTPGETILAADTTVSLGSEIFGKPINPVDAQRMLDALAGRRHDVLTGVCLRQSDRIVRECCSTAVWFAPMTQSEIDWYVASGEPMDKAGAYGIQGLASRFIDRIEGSYTNVVGLPVALVHRLLGDFIR